MHHLPHPDDAPDPPPRHRTSTMGISRLTLPDDLQAYAEERAFATGHDDRDSFIASLLRQDRERQELRERLITSMASAPAGFADDQYFEDLIQEMRDEATRRAQRGGKR